MSQISILCNKCDVCGHPWIPKPGVIYSHCTSSKCRSRKWNAGLLIAIGEELDKLSPFERAPGETDASLRESFQKNWSRTEFVMERAQHADGRWMVHAVRYVNQTIVADGWFELHRLQPYSPTGVDAIIVLLREKVRG